MYIQVYVTKGVEPARNEWANRLRQKGHKVHFALMTPFRKAEECDAYLIDGDADSEAGQVIAKAYAALDKPVFDESMLSDAANVPVSVVSNKTADETNSPSALAQAEIDKAKLANTGGDGAIPEKRKPGRPRKNPEPPQDAA